MNFQGQIQEFKREGGGGGGGSNHLLGEILLEINKIFSKKGGGDPPWICP